MPVINLTIFENDPDQLGENTEVTSQGEFVIVDIQMWAEGLGSYELAKIQIHHSVARKIGVAGVDVKAVLARNE